MLTNQAACSNRGLVWILRGEPTLFFFAVSGMDFGENRILLLFFWHSVIGCYVWHLAFQQPITPSVARMHVAVLHSVLGCKHAGIRQIFSTQ